MNFKFVVIINLFLLLGVNFSAYAKNIPPKLKPEKFIDSSAYSSKSSKFFDNLSKFYLQNLNKPFYRALLTNDYNYKSESFMLGDLYPAVEAKLLLQANLRGWENSSLFMSNINLISKTNDPKNLFSLLK